MRVGKCPPHCSLRCNGRPDLKRDSPQVPRLTFQKWKLEPYGSPRSPPARPPPCSSLGWNVCPGSPEGGQDHDGWEQQMAQGSAQLSGRASCKFNGGEQLSGICWWRSEGRSQAKAPHWVDQSLQTSADGCLSTPGQRPLALPHPCPQQSCPCASSEIPALLEVTGIAYGLLGLWGKACDQLLGLSKSEGSVLLVFLCPSQCDISEKGGEGAEIGLTLPNSGKFDSWTQTRNIDLGSKSYSIFIFALCSVSASPWPALLPGPGKVLTGVICLCLRSPLPPALAHWFWETCGCFPEACVLPCFLLCR